MHERRRGAEFADVGGLFDLLPTPAPAHGSSASVSGHRRELLTRTSARANFTRLVGLVRNLPWGGRRDGPCAAKLLYLRTNFSFLQIRTQFDHIIRPWIARGEEETRSYFSGLRFCLPA